MGSCCCKKGTEVVDVTDGRIIGKPTVNGDRIPLFNGLLYRIETGNQIAFYSNTNDYEFHITYLFGADSEIEALEDTNLEVHDDGILCELVVFPLETKLFVEGVIDGMENKIEARPLSAEYFSNHPELDEREYYRRVETPKTNKF